MNEQILVPSQNGKVENGSAIAGPEFPVATLTEAAPHFRRPFTANAVKFKVQSAYPKKAPTGALVVAYIDARLVADRLNMICPSIWQEEYEPMPDGMICRLTIGETTHVDFGEGYKGKGLYSDAFKRAAVKFGIGVSLYAVPAMHLNVQSGDLRVIQTGNGPSCALTVKGEESCRYRYRKWLADAGVQAFGEPLDHGDAEGATGDAEVEDIPEESGGTVPDEIAKKIVDRAWKIPDVKKGFQLAVSFYAGHDVGDTSTKAKAIEAVKTLDLAQAAGLDERITNAEAARG